MNMAGVSADSFLMRLAAGWMRRSRASNESEPFTGIASSPSSTKREGASARSMATTSGK